MQKVITEDNSITFYNDSVDDHYHSKSGAVEEAVIKHVGALNVLSKDNAVIFDMFFGLGYNACAALSSKKPLVYCFENDKEILQKILEIDCSLEHFHHIQKFITNFLNGNDTYECSVGTLVMVFGDARETIKSSSMADFVFFDPFSPSKVPEFWTVEFFKEIRKHMKENATLSTYSYARMVKDNFKEAGFTIKDGPILGRRSPSLIVKN